MARAAASSLSLIWSSLRQIEQPLTLPTPSDINQMLANGGINLEPITHLECEPLSHLVATRFRMNWPAYRRCSATLSDHQFDRRSIATFARILPTIMRSRRRTGSAARRLRSAA